MIEDTAPGKPLSISTTTFSDYVILTWEPPAEHVTIRGYTIGYGEGVPDVSWQYVEKDNRNVTIRDLSTFAECLLLECVNGRQRVYFKLFRP